MIEENSLKMIHDGKEWKPIPKYPQYYASSNGEVLSLRKGEDNPVVMKPISGADGHMYVFLYDKGIPTKMYVHRLVLSAWDRLPEGGEVARHLNDIPSDNRIENLAWGTVKDNSEDKVKNGRTNKGEKSPTHKLDETQVMLIREKFADGVGSYDLSGEFGVSQNQILMIVKGRSWKHLPLVPQRKEHHVKRRKPITEEEHCNRSNAIKKSKEKYKKPRYLIPCACGCGTMIMNIGLDCRPRRFAWGHNMRNKKTEIFQKDVEE